MAFTVSFSAHFGLDHQLMLITKRGLIKQTFAKYAVDNAVPLPNEFGQVSFETEEGDQADSLSFEDR